jgi:transcriptional regulator with XRE-family HTH domain
MRDRPRSRVHQHIANRVRQLRRECALTLNELATRSGVSRSMVSLIERGESSPTANILDKLAAALGVPLATLFAEKDKVKARPVSRRADQGVWRDPETGYLRRILSPAALASPIELVEVILPPDTLVRYDGGFRIATHHQQVWVLEGAVEVQVGSHHHVLKPGDCLAMLVDSPTSFRNRGKKRSRYLVAVSTGAARSVGDR